MKIKGYNIRTPKQINQSTTKKLLEANLNRAKINYYNYTDSQTIIRLYQKEDNIYVRVYELYDLNFNQFFNICSFIENDLNIKHYDIPEELISYNYDLLTTKLDNEGYFVGRDTEYLKQVCEKNKEEAYKATGKPYKLPWSHPIYKITLIALILNAISAIYIYYYTRDINTTKIIFLTIFAIICLLYGSYLKIKTRPHQYRK